MFALVACTPGDDTADGTRGLCAEGGALNDQCQEPITTARDACWRLVDCGAIESHGPDQGSYDWDRCVGDIETMRDVQQQIVIACIASSACDQLKVHENDDRPSCIRLGDN
jgi:hypothetical protein